MAKVRSIAFFSAPAIIVSLCLLLISPSSARFENMPTWYTVYTDAPAQIGSNYLQEDGGKVELGILSVGDDTVIPIDISVSDGSISGNVVLSVDEKYDDYISVLNLSASEITVTEEENAVFQVGIIIDNDSVGALLSPMEATFNVAYEYKIGTCDYSISSDFVLKLCPPSYTQTGEEFFLKSDDEVSGHTMFDEGKCIALSSYTVLLKYSLPIGSEAALTARTAGGYCLAPGTRVLGSETNTVLYNGGIVKPIVGSSGTGFTLFDFSAVPYEATRTFVIEATDGDEVYRDSVTVNMAPSGGAFTVNIPQGAPIASDKKQFVIGLTQNTALTDPEWQGAAPSLYSFGIEKSEDGKWVGQSTGISLIYTPRDANSADIAVSVDRENAQAGTYRLKIYFEYENIKIFEMKIPFFIDYR